MLFPHHHKIYLYSLSQSASAFLKITYTFYFHFHLTWGWGAEKRELEFCFFIYFIFFFTIHRYLFVYWISSYRFKYNIMYFCKSREVSPPNWSETDKFYTHAWCLQTAMKMKNAHSKGWPIICNRAKRLVRRSVFLSSCCCWFRRAIAPRFLFESQFIYLFL